MANQKMMAARQEVTFGAEIEVGALNQQRATSALLGCLPGSVTARASDKYGRACPAVRVEDGRVWMVQLDGSVPGGCEVVSPILKVSDMDTLQTVVRALRAAGGRATSNCGLHIHVGVQGWTAATVKNLVGIVAKNEALLTTALGVSSHRLYRYCQAMDSRFAQVVRQGVNSRSGEHVISSAWSNRGLGRFRGLNLEGMWRRGTAEFRWFDGTLHAGKVKACAQLCIALAAMAKTVRHVDFRQRPANRAAMVTFLRAYGLYEGEEFAAARTHLLSNFPAARRGRRARTTQQPAATPRW